MITIKQYKTCNGCRAFNYNSCGLGYNTKSDRELYNISVSYKPLEKCPKPKTYDDYITAFELYHK